MRQNLSDPIRHDHARRLRAQHHAAAARALRLARRGSPFAWGAWQVAAWLRDELRRAEGAAA